MSHVDLLIRQRCEEMINYAYVAIRHFPKFERHVLGAEIRATLWSLLRNVIVCNKRYHKKTTLTDLDAELDVLRAQVRVSYDLRYIDQKKYENWSRMNDEIGRMLGGWIKSQRE